MRARFPLVYVFLALAASCSSSVYWPQSVDFIGCDVGEVDGVIVNDVVGSLAVAVDDAVDAWPDAAGEASRLVVECMPRADAERVCGGGESCARSRSSQGGPAVVVVSVDDDMPAQVQHEVQHLRGEGPEFFCVSHGSCWAPLPCEHDGGCFVGG